MSGYKGQLDLTEKEIEEIDDNPELIHLYNARRIWSDLKIGQKVRQEIINLVQIIDKVNL